MGDSNNTLLVVAIVAVLASGLAFFLAYGGINSLKDVFLTPSGSGTVTVSIVENAEVTFTTSGIDYGGGFIPTGDGAETIDTEAGPASTPNGHWNRDFNLPNTGDGGDGLTGGFVMENTGNTNVEIKVSGSATAASFIGGTAPSFQYKVKEDPAALLACPVVNQVAGVFGIYQDVLTAVPGVLVCDRFLYDNTGPDSLLMEIRMVIPENADTDLSPPDSAVITIDVVGVA